MKYVFTAIMLTFAGAAFCQADLPGFLQGTWKAENEEIYEHWDLLNDRTLKGFSYALKDGQIAVSEYLDISQKGGKWVYTATVLNQNEGKGVAFKLTKTGDEYVFENPAHDFPKLISYKKLSETEILARASDGKDKSFSYKMTKAGVDPPESVSGSSNPNYDQTLAEKLGGDDYGMKNYIFVILKTGPNVSADRELATQSFRGHLDNINRLVEAGKLIVAGPMGKNDKSYRGIFILNNIGSMEEAQGLLQTDPAIKNGLLEAEIYDWYGSAALPEYLPFSDKIWKVQP